jgi:hypothetical protein
MSTVRLLKDCDGHKAGSTISVPMIKGIGMVKTGLAVYPEGSPPAGVQVDPAVIVKQLAALRTENGDLKAQIEELGRENGELRKLLESATKPNGPPKK